MGSIPILATNRNSKLIRQMFYGLFCFKNVFKWRPYYQCKFKNDTFDIYEHRGRKYSIYKNNIQVAWWEKSLISSYGGALYKLLADYNCEIEVIISFVLILDDYENKGNDKSIVSFDLGNIGSEAKRFNPDWQPKSINKSK